MELGLSLGDGSKTLGFFKRSRPAEQDKKPTKMRGLDFCMALGLNPPAAANLEPDRKAQEIRGDEDDQISQGDDASDDNQGKNTVQINLLPLLPPVNPHRRISSQLDQSLPWSSDIGSSENSSGNMGLPADVRGLNVHWLSAAAAATTEEVSSADSDGSLFIRSEFGMSRTITEIDHLGGSRKRSSDQLEAAAGSSRASDDDENGINTRKKLRLSKQQSAFLEQSFKEHNTLNPKQKLALAKQLNLRPRQVEVWFQNRRARTKLKQTEVDCEYLKRCCETLNDENRRLHKELQELRTLKTSKPFYMQLPATTLTMCPSCERVASASTVTAPPAAARTAAAIPFPLTRPRLYPFLQTQTQPNDQPAAS